MFTQKVVESDAFLDMPLSAQALYFHLNMWADDDGFLNSPKRIQRTVGASEDDLKLLIAKRFVMCFENGVMVIKHWRMHNTLRKDRHTPTQYQEELATLEIKGNNAYTEKSDNQTATTWQPNGNQTATTWQPLGNADIDLDIGLGLDIDINTNSAPDGAHSVQMHTDSAQTGPVTVASIEQDAQTAGASGESYTHPVTVLDGEQTRTSDVNALFEELWNLYPNKKGKARVSDKTKRTLYKYGKEQIQRCIERYLQGLKIDDWRKPQNGSTFFTSGYVDYLDENYKGVNSYATARGNPESTWGNDIDWGEIV